MRNTTRSIIFCVILTLAFSRLIHLQSQTNLQQGVNTSQQNPSNNGLAIQSIGPDGWENADDDNTTATVLNQGLTDTHSIYPAFDQDWFVFTLASPAVMVIQTYSLVDADTVITLYDSDLNYINDNDDYNNYQSYLNESLAAGTYYILVTGYGNRVASSYQLNLYSSIPDMDQDGISDSDESNVYHTDPNNWDSDGDYVDDFTEIFLANTDPLVVDSDGDGYDDYNELRWGTNPSDGTSHPIPDVWEGTDDTPSGATLLEEGVNQTHNIANPYDVDFFKFTLTQDRIISLFTTIRDNGDDTKLYLFDASGHKIDENDDYINLESNITKYLVTGNYYAYVSGYEDSTVTQYNITLNYQSYNSSLKDSDFDGLTDLDETSLGTNPHNQDTDGDGLSDYLELFPLSYYSNVPTDPLNNDSDADGYSDGQEYYAYYSNSTDPNVTSLDSDGDHLSDYYEMNDLSTNQSSPDTDSDGYSDFAEFLNGTDPLDNSSHPSAMYDLDGDGLNFVNEEILRLDDYNPDMDFDGLPDGVEVNMYHTDPLAWDTDGDGYFDGVEIDAGTNPLDPNSFPVSSTSLTSTNSGSGVLSTNPTSNTESSQSTSESSKKSSSGFIPLELISVVLTLFTLLTFTNRRKQ